MDAIRADGSRLDIVLMQMVNPMRDGKQKRMRASANKAITRPTCWTRCPADSARFASTSARELVHAGL